MPVSSPAGMPGQPARSTLQSIGVHVPLLDFSAEHAVTPTTTGIRASMVNRSPGRVGGGFVYARRRRRDETSSAGWRSRWSDGRATRYRTIAVVLGAVVLREPFSARNGLACAVVLAGTAIVKSTETKADVSAR